MVILHLLTGWRCEILPWQFSKISQHSSPKKEIIMLIKKSYNVKRYVKLVSLCVKSVLGFVGLKNKKSCGALPERQKMKWQAELDENYRIKPETIVYYHCP